MHQRSTSEPKSMPDVLQKTCTDVELAPTLSKGHKRWQQLSIALRSSRAISQARKLIKEKQDAINRVLRSQSYTAVDVEPECFSRIDKLRLSKLVKERNIDHLNELGRVEGLVTDLKTHSEKGIETDAEGISLRRHTFGSNAIQMPSAKMLQIVLETFKDPILLVLFLSASLSLGFGIKREGLKGVSDGLFIYVSIFLVMAAISFSNIWPTRQFHELSKSNNSISTDVIRDGTKQQISANDVVVGDIVCLQTGDRVPADGLYLDGNSFRVNESVLTKEANSPEITQGCDPFLLAGSKVTDGHARMLITAVGMDTKWGEMKSSKCPTEVRTPLQVKLHKLTQNTAKVGLAVASMVLMVLLIKYFTGNMKDDSGAAEYTSRTSVHHVCRAIIGILVTPIVIASAAIPEGLLLAVTITLAYSTKRMAAEKAVVRNLAACEAIGSVTVICVDRICLRPNVGSALREFQQAGVEVIMMTMEDAPNAEDLALACGMFSRNQTTTTHDIIEGTKFRDLTDQQRLEKVERISVITRASIQDKLLLVQCLKQKGHVVGVIGGCPDDKVFSEADVGFYLGTEESHSMKENPDIIIMDDSCTPIVRAMRWGRGIYNNIQIFAQFQLTATIASLVTDSVTTIFGGEPRTINIVTVISSGKIPFAALQILWVKLIVGTLFVLALSIDNPAESLMHEMPSMEMKPAVKE